MCHGGQSWVGTIKPGAWAGTYKGNVQVTGADLGVVGARVPWRWRSALH